MKIGKSEMAKLTALPNGESFDSIKKGEAWEKFKEIYYAVLDRPLTNHEGAWRCFLAGRASAPKGGPAVATKDMLMAAVKHENGEDIYTKLPAESLLVEEQMHAEAYAAMMAAAPTDALPVAVSDDAIKMLAVRLGLLVEVKGLHYSALALGESSSGEAVARFAQALLAQYGGHQNASAPEGMPEPDWWRKRADEIELYVAKSGSTEAMRCYTDMRTLLQAATEPQPVAQAVPPEPSDEDIDAVFNAMQDGMNGWLKSWGYRQFARALLQRWGGKDVGDIETMVAMLEAREWADHVGVTDLGERLENCISTLQNELHAYRASIYAVPTFNSVAQRKLQELQGKGYEITGYAIERPTQEGGTDRGFINNAGFVGWWPASAQKDHQ